MAMVLTIPFEERKVDHSMVTRAKATSASTTKMRIAMGCPFTSRDVGL
jgi:hypothetical protein